jgi:hypothetical protein
MAMKTLLLTLSLAGPASAGVLPASGLDRTLARTVRDGRVDYAGLRGDSGGLDGWLAAAAKVPEAAFQGWPRAERLAFLVNLYNAATLRLILDHYPLESIRKIGPVWDPNKAWKLPVVAVFGRTVSLNQIEHEMIRPVFKEPRVHFALVCAAKGCPPLRSEAYAADRLEAQLDDQAKVFLGQRAKNRTEAAIRTAYLSPIFKWYMEDFGGSKAAVLRFLKPWFPAGDGWAVEWTDYDWTLNEERR